MSIITTARARFASFVAAYAMGHFAGLLGVPVPQASTSDLQAAASQYAPFLEEVSDDH